MKLRSLASTLSPLLLLVTSGLGAVSTGNPFYGDAPDDHHPWAIHDRNRPQPQRVEPGTFSSAEKPGQPPSDAIVLFDGTAASLAQWESDTKENPAPPTQWIVNEGAMECVPKSGQIRTKQQIGDCQLHVEWAAPKNVKGDSQGRGNSGIFLMGLCEVQVLDNYNNPTYADGFAASVYGVNPPLANALRPPGEFQIIDIVFRRPVYLNGKVLDPGYVTVFCNGVLMQDHTPLEGPTGHMKRTVPGPFPEKGPLKLQDHGNPVRYRNIWYRDLPPRAIEGGTDGYLNADATKAKRREIAAGLRYEAARLTSTPTAGMLRLAESLVYEKDAKAVSDVEAMAQRYAAEVTALSPENQDKRKNEILSVSRAFKYLIRSGIVTAGFGSVDALDGIEKARNWDQKKN